MKAFLCDNVDLNRRVTARVINLAGVNFGDRHGCDLVKASEYSCKLVCFYVEVSKH